jgi:hypothetical protein
MFEDVLRPYVTSPINEKIKEELNNLSEEKRTALAKEFTKIKRPIVLENASKKLNEAMEDYLKSMQANMSKMNNLLKQLNDIATKNGMANLSQSIQNAQKTFSSTVMNQLASNPNELKTKTSQIASAETFTLILTRFLSDLKSIVFQIPTFKEWLENGDPNSKLGETLGQNSEEFKNAIIGLFDKAKSVAGRGLMAWLKQKFSFGGADAQNALEHFGYSGEKAYQDLAGLSNKQFKEMIQTGAVSAPQAVNIAKEAPSAETISKSSANPTRTPVDIANEFAAVIPTLDKATRQNVFSIVKKAIDASKQNLT